MAASGSKNLKLSSFGAGYSGSVMAKSSGKPASLASHSHALDADLSIAGPTTAGTSAGVIIPLIRSKDNLKQLPTYAAVLQRSADDYLTAEDLDNIQLELETLLSSVALRARVLKSEYESLDKDERRNDRRNKEKQPNSPAVPNSANNNMTNGKRKRDEPTSVRKKHSSMTILKQSKHTKNSPSAAHTDDSMDYMPTGTSAANASAHGNHLHSNGFGGQRDHQVPKMALPKNDMPNKFWLSVEPYCMPLTNEDIRLIDDLLDQYKGPLVPPIPDLGPHYSTVWANEDLKELQQASNPNTSNRLKPHNNNATSTTSSMLKKADAMLNESVTGPLTQRLVSALIEDQMIQHPSEQAAVGEHSNSSSENTHSSAPYNFRSLSMLKNCIGIEKRVKKELIEQGILDPNDFPHNDDDEILSEIKRVSAEISSIAQYNCAELKQLRAAAVEEIKRLEVKRKLDTIDQEILELYKRYMQCRAKRKPFTADEQQEVYRLTKEQRALSDQLERMRTDR